MNKNLWEFTESSHLKTYLQNLQNFAVVVVCLENTQKNIVCFLKKILKHKSKIYLNTSFLFYTAKQNELGSFEPIIDDNIESYPKLLHVDAANGEVAVGILSIDTNSVQMIQETFEQMNDLYLKSQQKIHAINISHEKEKLVEKIELLTEFINNYTHGFTEDIYKRKVKAEKNHE